MSKCAHALRGVACTAFVLVFASVLVNPARAQLAPLPLPVPPKATLGDTMCDKTVPATPPPTTQAIVSLYGWMSGISADVGVRDLSSNVDVRFVDLLKHLRFAAMGTFEVQYGQWLLISDNMYSSVFVNHTLSRGRVQPELDMTSKMFIGQAFVGYAMTATRTVRIDVLLGSRLWSTSSTLNVSGDLRSRERSSSSTWADALGGLRVRWAPYQRWQFNLEGDAGAGGSLSTVEGMATASYSIANYWSVWGAYRILYENYQKNEFFFRGHLDGPVIGVAYHW